MVAYTQQTNNIDYKHDKTTSSTRKNSNKAENMKYLRILQKESTTIMRAFGTEASEMDQGGHRNSECGPEALAFAYTLS